MAFLPDNKDWNQKIAEEIVPGYTKFSVYGNNNDIDIADPPIHLTDMGELYTFSTSADIEEMASTDNADTQLIEIDGLDVNWNRVIQYKTLTGQTPVTLTTPLIRVNQIANRSVPGVDIAGTVTLATNAAVWVGGIPNVSTTFRTQILGNRNKSLMAIFTVPNGKTGYIRSSVLNYAKSSSTGATLCIKARPYNSVFTTQRIPTVLGTGSSSLLTPPNDPIKLIGKMDLVVIVESVEANSTGLSAGFSILLKDD